jgi:putative tryptophan/tyrosine transport system substrate-binding protein
VRRRDFFGFVGSFAASWPRLAHAQQPGDLRRNAAKVRTIGFLGLAPASAWSGEIEALRAGLRDLGYVEGQNIAIEFRWATSVDDMPALASELVGMNVDAILAPASTQVAPARQATNTIPIIFAQHADPVGTGDVASLAHPGGNVTGVSMVLTELAAKGLEILKEAIPSIRKVGVLWNPTTPSHTQVVNQLKGAADSLNLQLIMAPVREAADFSRAFATMKHEQADGFVVPPSPLTNSQVASLAELKLQHRLPGMFGNKDNVRAGGLMSYGADFDYMYRHAAIYIDKVLKGEKPADLPVEQASKYYLIVNLKTAKALGTELSQTVIARADEVIE